MQQDIHKNKKRPLDSLLENDWVRKVRSWSFFGPVATLFIVAIIFSIGTGGGFVSFKNIQTILMIASVAAIVASASTMVVLLGCIDLSAEGVIALMAVICGHILKNTKTVMDLGVWAIPLVLVLGAAIGLITGLTTSMLRIPSFIASLGMMYTTMGLSIVLCGGATIKVLDPGLQNFANGMTIGSPNRAYVTILLILILNIILKRTRLGRFMYAVGGDEVLAQQAGVPVRLTKTLVFGIAGALYGLAAFFMVSRLQASNPQISKGMLFPAMTAVVVGGSSMSGGIGSATNAFLGALIVSGLNNGMVYMNINPYIQSAVNGVVLIAAVALTMDRKKIGIIK